jgi:hypothetical protein
MDAHPKTSLELEKDSVSIASSETPEDPKLAELNKAIKHGSYFPPSSPSRPAYLAARSLSAITGLLLILLAVLAKRVYDRPEYMAPILSPAINAWWASSFDALIVKWKDRRYPRLQRLLHDGAIGIGCSVAGGFLVAFALGDVRGTRDGGDGARGVAWAILWCMFAEV